MAEPIKPLATAEERQKSIDKQTSVGTYVLKQMYELAVLAGGIIAGAALFFGLSKIPMIGKAIGNNNPAGRPLNSGVRLFDMLHNNKATAIFSAVGAGIGSFLSGLTLGYGHWKNVESEKLAVGEINQDVGNLVAQRAKFAETLNRQEDFIKELIAQRQGKGDTAVERVERNAESAEATL